MVVNNSDFINKANYRFCLTFAICASLFLWILPFGLGDMINYPVRIFTTMIHEFGHGIAAIFTGGSISGVQINSDGSGHTRTIGGWMPLIASAGYFSTTLVGMLLLSSFKRAVSDWVMFTGLMIISGLIGIYSIFYSPVTALAALAYAFFFYLLSFKLGTSLGVVTFFKSLFIAYLSVQLISNSLSDFMHLLRLSATTTTHTDAVLMAEAMGGTSFMWALIWMICSLGMCWVYIRR